MSEENRALLSQKEIDTLVSFLSQQQSNLDGEVLNQDSIDKLILLLKNVDGSQFKFDVNTSVPPTQVSMESVIGKLTNIENYATAKKVLEFSINETSGYIEIYVNINEMGKNIKLTPENLDKVTLQEQENSTEWGYFIAPVLFDNIANVFGIKYHKSTLDQICEIYAQKSLGDKNKKISEIFLPTSTSVFNNILSE